MKLNSHAKEIIVNININLEELQHLHQYLQYLRNFPNDGGFNLDLIINYEKQVKSIIQEVERNA